MKSLSGLVRIFARDTTFSWEWNRIDVSQAGDLAWFFADGRVVLSTVKEQRKSPFKMIKKTHSKPCLSHE